METMPQKVNKKYGTKTEIGPRVKIPVSVYKRFTFKCNNTKRVDRFIKEKLEHKEEYYKIEFEPTNIIKFPPYTVRLEKISL